MCYKKKVSVLHYLKSCLQTQGSNEERGHFKTCFVFTSSFKEKFKPIFVASASTGIMSYNKSVTSSTQTQYSAFQRA
jgi:hypothetical protein